MNSYNMVCFIALMALMISASTVTAQTFQYSRGWTNGKRAGLYESNMIDRIIANPCQVEKLRYILQGKPLNEKLMVPCDMLENEVEPVPLRLRRSAPEYEQRNQDNRPDFV